MSISQFDQFKNLLTVAVQDVDFVRKNEFLQDTASLQIVLDRIGSLTADVNLYHTYVDVDSQLGFLQQDEPNRTITFDPKGFGTALSGFREGLVSEPRRIFARQTVADDVAYLLADGGIGVTGKGVYCLNSSMKVLRRFPHFGPNTAAGQYEDPADVITFMIGTTEYVAVADATHHVVLVYLYAAPYTLVSTIGTVDTPGAAANLLTAPNGLAVDTASSVLYISCPTGQPAGATASNGFIAAYDISAIGAPAFSSAPIYYAGTGSLLDAQVHTPVGLVFRNGELWITNQGDDTVGSISLAADPVCTGFIEASGAGYTLRSPEQICFYSVVGGVDRLYVTNRDTGTVEEFNTLTYQHVASYGIRASEDAVPVGYQRLSSDLYGVLGQPSGVVANTVEIDGTSTKVLIVTDPANLRLHQFNLDAYGTNNLVNFTVQQFDVPVVFEGWSITGTVPLDLVTVWYRFDTTEDFRKMPQTSVLSATRKIQFRLSCTLDTRKFVKTDWTIERLVVHGKQA